MKVILEFTQLQLIHIAIVRFIGIPLLAFLVLPKMWHELNLRKKTSNKWFEFILSSELLILVLGVAYLLGSMLPFEQILCYVFGCLDLTNVLPISIVVAYLNLIGITILVLFYNTRRVDK